MADITDIMIDLCSGAESGDIIMERAGQQGGFRKDVEECG